MPPRSTALIFDIQRFCLHDGPGIRTVVFLKGCPLRCAWCQNPESLSRKPELAFYAERCQRCFACREACPEGAIVDEASQRIDYARCTCCGECAAACLHGGLRSIGRRWEAEALARELEKDRDHFEDSGGGVTFSGGEPMAQAPFLARLLPELKARAIAAGLETCGLFRWEQISPLLADIAFIYFDLKLMDAAAHRQHTGQDNRVILENFTRLAECAPRLQARMPIVPGLNDHADNLRETARFLRRRGQRTIHCLPYHRFGEAKLPRLHGARQPLALPPQSVADLDRVRHTFAEEGIDAIICD